MDIENVDVLPNVMNDSISENGDVDCSSGVNINTNEGVVENQDRSDMDNNDVDDEDDGDGNKDEDDGQCDEKENNYSVELNGKHTDSATENKRQRKKVQRLSETWNRVYECKEEERAKAIKKMADVFGGGDGTALGDIPLIEATFRKVKPVELKVLHSIIYGRPGTANEVRSNLRKFRGFGFKADSNEYEKKITYIKQRTLSDLRQALRVLNLEVSGTRDQLALRVMEFLHKPLADMVKYKGKVKKSNRGPHKHTDEKKTKSRKSVDGKVSKRKSNAKSVSSNDASRTDDQDSLSDMDSDNEDPNDLAYNVKNNKIKSDSRVNKANTSVSKPKKIKKAVVESDDEANDLDLECEEEDVPLSTLAVNKTAVPTDSQLKKNIIDLLKTVNLEETSLKVVREKIFATYPGVDLTDRKEFINTTVKEYLSQ